MITFSGWVNIAKEILKGSFSGIGDLNISTH